MENKEFEQVIKQAVKSLPQEFLHKLENVSIVIQDYPSHRQQNLLLNKGGRGILLGLYEGIPHTKRGHYGIGGALPDKITIFKIPLLMVSHTMAEVRENIKTTVIHEIAHHFGLSEEDIRQASKS